MNRENKRQKRKTEGNKPRFRSAAKAAGYDYLVSSLKAKQRALSDNKYKLASIQREQRELKKDIAGLHQVNMGVQMIDEALKKRIIDDKKRVNDCLNKLIATMLECGVAEMEKDNDELYVKVIVKYAEEKQ